MRLNDILDRVTAYAPDANVDVIMRAYLYAAKMHAGQTRKSGEPYLIHPMAVAGICAELQLDVDTIATALLHDTVEDCLTTHDELVGLFGGEVAELVDGVTKIGKLQFRSKEEAHAENFRKMILAMGKDVRVILVKIADRLHNMRTMDAMRPDKQAAISQETLDIYAPIANRLGLSRLKAELEDLCFRYLHPAVWEELSSLVDASAADRNAFIESVQKDLSEFLGSMSLEAKVTGRSKHLYSIYRKMRASNLEFDQVHDLLAFRVIVGSIGECYTALGHVHAHFHAVPDRIKDYISNPKSNGYQSLHTVVLEPGGRQFEIQIRTPDMHRIAEVGIAAHWRYKEGHLALSKDDIGKIARLRELFEAARDVDDAQEFLETIKVDLFRNEIFVFSPKGDVYTFAQGATALDFAYAVHTEVGNRCVGAKVNGRMVPLRYVLQNGDRLEIQTSPTQKPSRDWLEIAHSGRALAKIRKTIHDEERALGIQLGRDMIEAELKRHERQLQDFIKSGEFKALAKKLGFRDPDKLFASVAHGDVATRKVAADLLGPDVVKEEEQQKDGVIQTLINRLRKRSESPVIISGEEDLLVAYARCCSPLPGEPVVGFITRGRGISIHLASCPQLLAMDAERRIPVDWHPKHKGKHTGDIRLVCTDKPGMLADIAHVCKTMAINITKADTNPLEDNKAGIHLEITVTDVQTLQKLMRNLEKIRGVIKVDRIRTQQAV